MSDVAMDVLKNGQPTVDENGTPYVSTGPIMLSLKCLHLRIGKIHMPDELFPEDEDEEDPENPIPEARKEKVRGFVVCPLNDAETRNIGCPIRARTS